MMEQCPKDILTVLTPVSGVRKTTQPPRSPSPSLHNGRESVMSLSSEPPVSSESFKLEYENGAEYSGGARTASHQGKSVYVRHGYGTLTHPCGFSMTANWVLGVASGKCQFSFPSDVLITSYDGHMEAGKYHGHGTAQLANGSSYSGDWQNGIRIGKGKMEYPNGDIYVGDFVNNQREGQGTMDYVGGIHYVGEWKANLRHGRGTAKFTTGDTYEGLWADGLREGRGKWYQITGTEVTMEFRSHQPVATPNAFVLFQDGKAYEGPVDSQGCPDTRASPSIDGLMTFPSGLKYSGEFAASRRQGKGTLVFPVSLMASKNSASSNNLSKFAPTSSSMKEVVEAALEKSKEQKLSARKLVESGETGRSSTTDATEAQIFGQVRPDGAPALTVYTGQFEMDQPLDGEASAEYITDERYHGQMKAGCRQGNGKSVSDIGSSYRGEWQMDQPHGFGKINYPPSEQRASGMVWYEGLICHGKPHTHSVPDATGQAVFADGRVYVGQWAEGLPHGTGEMKFAGETFVGEFHRGIKGEGETLLR